MRCGGGLLTCRGAFHKLLSARDLRRHINRGIPADVNRVTAFGICYDWAAIRSPSSVVARDVAVDILSLKSTSVLIGPIFSRELVTTPRREQHFLYRGVYGTALFVLMCTAWLVLAGTQIIRGVGDMAK